MWIQILRRSQSASSEPAQVKSLPPALTVMVVLGAALASVVFTLVSIVWSLGRDESAQAVPQTVRASEVDFTGNKTLSASLTMSSEIREVQFSGSGTVTASSCSPGARLETGDLVLSVDAHPRVALATPEPLWRELEMGVTAEEVTQVQTLLRELGYGVTVNGVYDEGTRNAIAALWSEHGATNDGRGLGPDDVIWLPTDPVVVEQCEFHVGDSITAGPLLTLTPTVSQLHIDVTDLQSTGVTEYVAISGESRASIQADGTIVDHEFLAAWSSSDAFASWMATPDAERGAPRIDVELAEPIAAYLVPAAAVAIDRAGTACVHTDGGAHPVLILGSQLGQTIVTTKSDLVDSDLRLSSGQPSCQ